MNLYFFKGKHPSISRLKMIEGIWNVFDYGLTDIRNRSVITINNKIGILGVEGLTFCKNFSKSLIGCFNKGTTAEIANPLFQRCESDVEQDQHTAPSQVTDTGLAINCTATRCNNMLSKIHRKHGLLFQPAEILNTKIVQYFLQWQTPVFFDKGIDIDKGKTKEVRKFSADGTFSGSSHADQNNICFFTVFHNRNSNNLIVRLYYVTHCRQCKYS